jgi:hypothetical protein
MKRLWSLGASLCRVNLVKVLIMLHQASQPRKELSSGLQDHQSWFGPTVPGSACDPDDPTGVSGMSVGRRFEFFSQPFTRGTGQGWLQIARIQHQTTRKKEHENVWLQH